MARPTFQDIIPPERRSIKKISIPQRPGSSRPSDSSSGVPTSDGVREIHRDFSQNHAPYADEDNNHDHGVENRPLPPFVPQKSGNGKKIFIITGVIVIVLAALGSTVYSMYRSAGAVVTITSQTQSVSVNANLNASQSSSSSPNLSQSLSLGTTTTIQFETVSLVRDGELTLPATTQGNIETKATGSIVVYNDYSSAAQKLIANTRFETSDGLIFRIGQAITVPGTHVSGGKTIPGSVTVTVTADQPGADYNIGLSDFTVPGFKGTPQYAAFYGRSKTVMSGGYSGTEASVDATEITAAKQKIQTELQADMLTEIQNNIPEGYVLPGNAYILTYATLPQSEATTSVTISQEATLHAFVFNQSQLADEIAKRAGANLSSLNLGIGTNTGLAFKLIGTSTTTPWNLTSINFNLTGTTTLVSIIDPDQIRIALSGQPRTSLNAIVANYPGIATVEAKITPFWNNHFPTDPSKISVIIATSTP